MAASMKKRRNVFGGSPKLDQLLYFNPILKENISEFIQMLNLSNAGMANLKTLKVSRTSKEQINQKQIMTLLMLCTLRFNESLKATRKATRNLLVPQSTVVKILHKRLQLRAYEAQIFQALQPNNFSQQVVFAGKILDKIEKNNDYLQHVAFSDEATFHLSGRVNKHNVQILGSENPHVMVEYQKDSCKLNVWSCLLHDRVIGSFFF